MGTKVRADLLVRMSTGISRQDVKQIALNLIADGVERDKVDFKREIVPAKEASAQEKKKAKSRLLQALSAFANTRTNEYEDHGFLVIGVHSGKIVGIKDTESDTDKLHNTIAMLIDDYIQPRFNVEVQVFETEDEEKWAVILVPPSGPKPHVIVRELRCEDARDSLDVGDWFVRRGPRTVRARPEDYARLLDEAVLAAIIPLKSELERLAHQQNQLLDLFARQRADSGGSAEPSAGPGRSAGGSEPVPETSPFSQVGLATRLRQRLAGPLDQETRDLLQMALDLRAYLDAMDGDLPWEFGRGEPELELRVIQELEERVRELLSAVATIVAYDSKDALVEPLARVVRILAKRPLPAGTFTDAGRALRLYPLYLVLTTIFVVGVPLGRASHLRKCLDVEIEPAFQNEAPERVASVGYIVTDIDSILRRHGQPALISQRARELVSGAAFSVTVGVEPSIYYIGEFILGLAALETYGLDDDWSRPSQGTYLYNRDARSVLISFLRSRPEWLAHLFEHPIEALFSQFDRTAQRASTEYRLALGFTGGALEAYKQGETATT